MNKGTHFNYVLAGVLMLLLFNFPILSAANKHQYIGHVPLLYAYILIVWLSTILLLGLLIARRDKSSKRNE